MASQFEEMQRVNEELLAHDKNGTMTQNPGGETMNKNRGELVLGFRKKLARKEVSTAPTTGKKAGKAAALKAVQTEIESHTNEGMEPGE